MNVASAPPRAAERLRAPAPLESLVASLGRRAELDRPAFTHIDYREDRAGLARTLSWSDVHARSLAVAAAISELAGPAERVAVLCPQDLNYPIGFLGALTAGTIAVPLFAPEASSHAGRLVGALADCQATVWLTTQAALESVQQLLDDPRVTRPAGVIAVDLIDLRAGSGFASPDVDLGEPAYLQYTSGATRDPAGAVISHEAVVANVRQGIAALALDERTTSVGWIPFFHDMGLMMMVCAPVVLGSHAVFSAPFDFVQRPRRWLEQLSSYPNVMTAAPNFAYDYAVERVAPKDRASLDLSGVHVAVNGSEPVRAGTLERFQEAFGPCGFAPEAHRPSYGLAEATLFVTTSRPGPPHVASFARDELLAGRAVPATPQDETTKLVSAGAPAGQHVAVVDPLTRAIRSDGDVGEVWVHGRNVASGYWGQPERSSEVFDARLTGGGELPETGWLRTGDLGVSLDGELYITGRLKEVIIVDGKNHYPQDIEETVQGAHPAIRAGRVAAFGMSTDDGEAIIVVMERARGAAGADAAPGEISTAVRRAVSAAHDLKVRDIQILEGTKVLRTSSGKIARAANRERYAAGRER
ncbi:MAG TPA: fatty acyl-AMP ligase [Solirubrobacteraceae bacterium]|jgi:fatty acid CoA ligase FadD32|nr:fatty acyl-AMP ligase [Solirubrobacteraceae bacterium]